MLCLFYVCVWESGVRIGLPTVKSPGSTKSFKNHIQFLIRKNTKRWMTLVLREGPETLEALGALEWEAEVASSEASA